ncbi:hypothetical protein [Vibrio sonorensis]|uniref:hypothetical protein n=1 Tax=Vibrio sonorensis TaxID=1004316 RepID=UPI0008DAFA6C|nr:hypothetical protein [Vibrio sonorensis]
MDKDKASKLIDSVSPEKIDKALKAISGMSEEEFEIAQAKVWRETDKKRDQEALESDMQIERITIYLKGDNKALLVKPNKWLDPETWSFNCFESGAISFSSKHNPKFSIDSIPAATPEGDLYRLRILWEGFSYWVDLIDEEQAKDLSKFLDIPIESAI